MFSGNKSLFREILFLFDKNRETNLKLHHGAMVETYKKTLRLTLPHLQYLLNLDTNSAHYDPKSRSMRDNPLKDLAHKKPSE